MELVVANKYAENFKLINDNESYFNLEKTWMRDHNKTLLPQEILQKRALNYARNVADDKILEDKDRSIMVGISDKSILGENINKLNQNESFIESSIRSIGEFFGMKDEDEEKRL